MVKNSKNLIALLPVIGLLGFAALHGHAPIVYSKSAPPPKPAQAITIAIKPPPLTPADLTPAKMSARLLMAQSEAARIAHKGKKVYMALPLTVSQINSGSATDRGRYVLQSGVDANGNQYYKNGNATPLYLYCNAAGTIWYEGPTLNNYNTTSVHYNSGSGNTPTSFPLTGWTTNPVFTSAPAPNFTPGLPSTYAFVTNPSTNKLSVITLATGVIAGTIPTGTNPTGIAISTDGSKAYVCNNNTLTVSVITLNGLATTTVTMPGGSNNPSSCTLSPDGTKLWVSCFHTAGSTGNLVVIDTTTLAVSANINSASTNGANFNPAFTIFSADGTIAYVLGNGYFNQITTSSYAITYSGSLVNNASMMAISADGTKGYIPQVSISGGAIVTVNLSTHVATTGPAEFNDPNFVIASVDGSKLYVGDGSSVLVYALPALTLSATLTGYGTTVGGMAVSADGLDLYTVQTSGSTVTDTTISSNAVAHTYTMAAAGSGIALGNIYVPTTLTPPRNLRGGYVD